MRLRRCVSSLSQVLNHLCACLFLLSVLGALWRYYQKDCGDRYKCESTLTQGKWLDAPSNPDDTTSVQPSQDWQAPGCLLHQYKAEDIERCLQGRQILLIGDSTIRQIYWAIVHRLDSEKAYQDQHTSLKHSNQVFQKDGVTANFIWDPYLNSSALHRELHRTALADKTSAVHSPTAIIVVGGGLWHARYLWESGFEQWKSAIGNVSARLDKRHPCEPQLEGALKLLAPVQVPFYDALSEDRRQTIKPSIIDAMNAHLVDISAQRGTPIAWAFHRMLREQPSSAFDVSGLHVNEDIANHIAEVILNLRCNGALSQIRGYPMDMTCCSGYATPTWAQSVIVTWSLGLVVFLGVLSPCMSTSRRTVTMPLVKALGALAFALTYCYYADRTQLWNKAQKHFIVQEFKSYLALPLLAGVLTIRGSVSSGNQSKASSDQPFLSRDQTDEWKGWMQVAILVYHYTGASKILPIYEFIRLLVASYLFMTGFGHAIFYYKKPDYSLKRVTSVLIRLNMLSILLPYVMQTDYLLYYFAPLTSFWFCVIYLTMGVARKRNHDFAFIAGKIVISAVIINLMIRTRYVFEGLFKLLERTCNIHWNVREWRFRLQLDSYIVYVGMLSGILFTKTTNALDNDNSRLVDNFSIFIMDNFKRIRCLAIIAALVTPSIFYLLAGAAPNKFIYNDYIPYTSLFPILSFIILRNATRTLRYYHSSAFAWVGKISLETFTLQFHIWLAADTKGLLRTGLLDVWCGDYVDMAVLTVLFLWVSKKVSDATGTITHAIVNTDTERSTNMELQVMKQGALLPRTKSKGDLTCHPGAVSGVSHGIVGRSGAIMSWIGGDLRVRLAAILFLLWALNMTY